MSVEHASARLQNKLGLTIKQSVVAYRVASGESPAEIAKAMHTSPHTVRRHVEAIYEKLRISNRAALELKMRRCLG